ncbi:hypothetical protein T12_9538 [Trichinella patagoniensis]|uniref:Uncharacterized protein n=1 Tax=Trichinella patagoniensis TaxID=990121 RepID=A0A0V0ZZS8_9BILA|nr:hypothetical protein T12_9538 [Trichinella patagoniensis]
MSFLHEEPWDTLTMPDASGFWALRLNSLSKQKCEIKTIALLTQPVDFQITLDINGRLTRKLLTPDLRYSVFNTLTRLSIAIPEKNSADPLLFCFLPMFWLHNILDNLRDQQPSGLVSLMIRHLIWRTFDGGWRSNIKEFTASSAANTYKDASPLCSRSGQRFHGISDDLHQFREILQEVLSVNEQLNTVTVHLHPLNLLCTSFSYIGRIVKKATDSHHRLQCQVEDTVQQLQRIPSDIKKVDVQLAIMKVICSTGKYLVEMSVSVTQIK